MIKKLQRKFVLLTTLTVAIILLIIVVVVNLSNYIYIDRQTDNIIASIEVNGGKLLQTPYDTENEPEISSLASTPDSLQAMAFFVAFYDESGVTSINISATLYLDTTTAEGLAVDAIDSGKTSKYLDGYKFKLCEIEGQSAIIFVDVSSEIGIIATYIVTSVTVSFGILILTLFISTLFSKYAIRPIAAAYAKQKKFITNASHELKTPLTIISANMDILELETSDEGNSWILNTKEQVVRLTELTTSMVELSRMDETHSVDKIDISITEMAEMAVESFASVAKNQEKHFDVSIERDIIHNVNEKNISQLLYILLDNAFKYSLEKGSIIFSASKKQGKLKISVSNTAEAMDAAHISDLFDRFYRGDKSRSSEKSGYGIGLALAKSIVDAHKGKISAKYNAGMFTIKVVL
ncbi:MAG: HAMP domain-containing sensor histidine kinase [Bacillota bacterium]